MQRDPRRDVVVHAAYCYRRAAENLKSEHVQSNRPFHTGAQDTTQTGPSCSVWRGGVN